MRKSKCTECYQWIIEGGQPQLKSALGAYNSMVQAFAVIKDLSGNTYAELESGAQAAAKNAMGQLRLACDENMDLQNSVTAQQFELRCGDGLWSTVGLTKRQIP